MLHLNDDGTVTIDFETAGDDGGPLAVTLRRPRFGQFKRLRSDAAKVLTGMTSYVEELKADEALSETDRIERLNQRTEDATVAWWHLVLIGDDTFASLADRPADVPDVDDWPTYLAYGDGSIKMLLDHWRRVPLAPGVSNGQHPAE